MGPIGKIREYHVVVCKSKLMVPNRFDSGVHPRRLLLRRSVWSLLNCTADFTVI